jgi:hypothetical protein
MEMSWEMLQSGRKKVKKLGEFSVKMKNPALRAGLFDGQ